MDKNVYYNLTVLAFERALPLNEPKAVRLIYVKQSEETKGYVIKFMLENGEKVVYTTSQWLPTVLTTVALLMAEHGIGCPWRSLNN